MRDPLGRFGTRGSSIQTLPTFSNDFGHVEGRVMLLGRGYGEPAFHALATEPGIVDRVIFAGFDADPSPFYATVELFPLSSDDGGFGNVIVEAQSFDVPLVPTDCASGSAEILEHGRYGMLVSVVDATGLPIAMDEVLSCPHDREPLKRRARDFDPEKRRRLNCTC